jgi:hypothetical protein
MWLVLNVSDSSKTQLYTFVHSFLKLSLFMKGVVFFFCSLSK